MKTIASVKGETFVKIKLPAVSKFKGTKKLCPYEKFHLWVGQQFGEIKDRKINVSASWIMRDDDIKLRILMEEWLQRVHGIGRKKVADHLSWIALDIGPAVFFEEKLEKGFVYVKKEEIFKVED